MTSKKIIFCDIDGTLSKKGHPISKENINAIATFIKEGNMFVLSTGRSIVSANKYNKQIHEACGHFPEYTISSNGGYIRKNSTNEATRFYMESAIARRVYDYARANKL
jgi:HAD superfamily hydrolase (TIGR01484 family)